MKNVPKSICLFIGLFCLSIGLSGQAKGKYYLSYLREEGSMLYFIKPISFIEKVNMDITFVKDSFATINFSILSDSGGSKIDSLFLENENFSFGLTDHKLLFEEFDNRAWEARYTAECKYEELVKVFTNDNWGFVIFTNGVQRSYKIKSKSKKNIHVINQRVFLAN